MTSWATISFSRRSFSIEIIILL